MQRAVFRGAGLAFVARCRGRISACSISLGTKLHFIPVGKPAPPRPRRLDFFTSSMIGSGVICFRAFSSALIAAVLQIGVDLRRIGDAEALADHGDFGGMALVQRAGNYRERAWGLLPTSEAARKSRRLCRRRDFRGNRSSPAWPARRCRRPCIRLLREKRCRWAKLPCSPMPSRFCTCS